MKVAKAILQAAHWHEDSQALTAKSFKGVTFGTSGIGAEVQPTPHHAKQVHGTHIVPASDATAPHSTTRPEADGLLTTAKKTRIGIKTADCLPVLFLHPNLIVGAHAGWRGLTAGILTASLSKFSEHAIALADVKIVIGAAISAGSYEVGEEVITAMQQGPNPLNAEEFGYCVLKGKTDRWHFDLQAAAVLTLAQHGAAPANIHVLRQCTRLTPQAWHSYRRDKEKMGRNWLWAEIL